MPGASPPPGQKKSRPAWVVPAVALLLLIVIVGIANSGSDRDKPTAGSSSDSSSSSSESRPSSTVRAAPTYSTEDYQDASVSTCQKAIKQGLKDPDSAKFGDDWKAWKITSPNSTPPDGMTYDPAAGDQFYNASGSVNAKSAFGGYVGAQPYYCDVVISSAGNVRARAHDMEDMLQPTPTP